MIRALPLLLLTACGVSEDAFPRAYARAMCARMAECQRGEYDQQYDARADCVEAWADVVDGVLDAADLLGATYSPTGGYQCITALRGATCAEAVDLDVSCELFE